MDRAQPGARGSTNRNIEFGETTSQFSDGWIVPADDPTLSAQRYTSIDETAFNEFDATYSGDSLTVTIDPGEAFVDGWLARDVTTNIALDADTAGQTIVIGWDPDAIYDDQQHDTRDEADRIIVTFESDINPSHPAVEIWMVDTDGSGVTNITDYRDISHQLRQNITGRKAIDYRDVVVDHPDRLPITELKDGESIEIPVRLDDDETLEVYRWGAFDVDDGTAPSNLKVELPDETDVVQASENTPDTVDGKMPIVSHENTSGAESIFKLRAKNDSREPLDSPGVGAHFGYMVV